MRQQLVRMIWVIFFAAFGSTLFVGVAFSQIDRANLNGTVTDASGGSIPNAKVEVVAPDTGFKRQATTAISGVYSLSSLPTGTYDLTVSGEGFKTLTTKGIQLSVGQTRTVNVQLEVGAPTTKVEVRGTAQALDSNDAEISTVIQSRQVEDIPLNGRDWSLLMTLAPGAVNLGAGGQRDLRFVGRGIDDSNYTYDGLDATGVQEQSQKVGVRLAISLESIAEFRVSSSVYTADQGGSAGAIVSIVSKTGTNAFHGSAFDFLRNNVFDARSPFDFPSIPPFRLNQFGASLGGAIKKDRTFFYMDYEGLRQRLDTTVIGFVPNAAFRASVTNPVLQPFLAQWPDKGLLIPVDDITNEWVQPQSDNIREDSGMFRLDHIFTDRTSIFARINIDDANTSAPLDTLGGLDNPLIRPSNYVVQLTHTFSPTIINELRGGINRSALHHYQNGTCPQSSANGLPGTICADVSGPFDGPSDSQLDEEVGTTIDGYDDLTIVRGRHTIKMGIGVERHRLNNSDEIIGNGDLSYDSTDDFLNNVVDSYSYVGPLTLGGERRTYIMPYVQDTFKVRSNLTLNYGLRWEHYTVLKEAFGRQAVVKVSCGGFCPKGTLLYSPYYLDFAPRLGLAWAPGGNAGKTVIRAGFGMYFSPNQMDDFTDGHESTDQRFAVSSADVPNLAWPILPPCCPPHYTRPRRGKRTAKTDTSKTGISRSSGCSRVTLSARLHTTAARDTGCSAKLTPMSSIPQRACAPCPILASTAIKITSATATSTRFRYPCSVISPMDGCGERSTCGRTVWLTKGTERATPRTFKTCRVSDVTIAVRTSTFANPSPSTRFTSFRSDTASHS